MSSVIKFDCMYARTYVLERVEFNHHFRVMVHLKYIKNTKCIQENVDKHPWHKSAHFVSILLLHWPRTKAFCNDDAAVWSGNGSKVSHPRRLQ